MAVGDLVFLTANGVAHGAIYASVALALVMIWRSTRILNFAQGAMALTSVYVGFETFEATGSVWLAMAAALFAGAMLGLLADRAIMRFVDPSEPLTAVIVTLGLLTFLQGVLGIAFGSQFRAFPTAFSTGAISVGSATIISPQDLFTVGSVAVVMAALLVLFTKTDLGLRLRASAFAPGTARLLGVDVSRMLTVGWVLASVVAALGGLLAVPSGIGLSPTALDGALILGFTAAVIGGLDSAVGALVGGVGLGVLLSLSSHWWGSTPAPIVSLAVLVAVLLLRPGGLFTFAGARKV